MFGIRRQIEIALAASKQMSFITLDSWYLGSIARSMRHASSMEHDNQHSFRFPAAMIHEMIIQLLSMPIFFMSYHKLELEMSFGIVIFDVDTFIASSSVVSSPAKITFTFSFQLSPNSSRKICNAASPAIYEHVSGLLDVFIRLFLFIL